MNSAKRAIAVAALLLIASARPAAAPAAGQMDDQMKRTMGLTYESLEAVLKDLQAYDTSDVGPAMRLRAYVFANKDNAQARKEAEAALLKFIQGSPAPAGRMAACRALGLIGGTDSVPVLAELVLKPESTDAARFALERIPGGEADRALIAALDKTQGQVKRGVVFSLGERSTAAAVPALTRLASGKDAVLAADAIKSLGRAGGPEALKALGALLTKAPAGLRPEAASALLAAAEDAAGAGDKAGAAAAYDRVFAAAVPPATRQAAFRGKLGLADDPRAAILRALTGREALLYAPALAAVPAHFGPDRIGEVAETLGRLPDGARVHLAALLAGYPAEAVRPHLLGAAEDPSLDVRLAALRAIAAAGDGRSVLFLATKAARAAGAEREAAREALARLRGRDVDAAVLAQLAKASDEDVKAELIQAAGSRRVDGAKTELMALVKSPSPALRSRAAAALRTAAATPDLPDLLDLLAGLDDEAAREAMQDTIAAVARTNPREDLRAAPVKPRLETVKDPAKRSDLLRVLGKIGDDTSLALVRKALADPDPGVVDAAVRALADRPTVTARDDIFEVARTSLILTHRVLAARAYVRLVGSEPHRAPEAAAAHLLQVLSLSPRPEEKRLVLGMLVRFPCVTALKMAESLQADAAVAEEARLAADRIRNALK